LAVVKHLFSDSLGLIVGATTRDKLDYIALTGNDEWFRELKRAIAPGAA
jgi:hypothetical protein